MIEITETSDGCILPVRAQPGAKKTGIVGEHAGALKVGVHAAPEQGKANKALIEVLSRELGLKKSQIELLSGETSRDKRFVLHGVTAVQLRSTLAAKQR
jgi:uncharacterized protein